MNKPTMNFMMRPVQRVMKYQLLVAELRHSLLADQRRNSLQAKHSHSSAHEGESEGEAKRLAAALEQVNMAMDLATRLASLVNLSIPEHIDEVGAGKKRNNLPRGRRISKVEISKPVFQSFRRMPNNGILGAAVAGTNDNSGHDNAPSTMPSPRVGKGPRHAPSALANGTSATGEFTGRAGDLRV